VPATSCARRRLIRSVRLTSERHDHAIEKKHLDVLRVRRAWLCFWAFRDLSRSGSIYADVQGLADAVH